MRTVIRWVGTTGSSTGQVPRIVAVPGPDRQPLKALPSHLPGHRPKWLSVVHDRDAHVVHAGLDPGIATRIHGHQLDRNAAAAQLLRDAERE